MPATYLANPVSFFQQHERTLVHDTCVLDDPGNGPQGATTHDPCLDQGDLVVLPRGCARTVVRGEAMAFVVANTTL